MTPSLAQTTDLYEAGIPHWYKYKILYPSQEPGHNQPLEDDQKLSSFSHNMQERTENVISLKTINETIHAFLPGMLEALRQPHVPAFEMTEKPFSAELPFTINQFNAYAPLIHLDWRSHIHNAKSNGEIMSILKHVGLVTIAKRLTYLKEITDEDDEELDGKPIMLESLRMSAIFLIENVLENRMPSPQITVSYEGLIYLRWKSEQGVLGMEFQTSGLIRFAAIIYGSDSGSQRPSVSGTLLPEDMLNAVKPITDQLL